MTSLSQIALVLGLGLFWAASPALNKALGLAGIPVPTVMMAAGLGVGLGLGVAARIMGQLGGIGRAAIWFGLGCGLFTNVPFFISLTVIRHVPVGLMAVVTSTSPLWTYGIALLIGRETFGPLRLLALILGLASSLVLIVTRPGTAPGLEAGAGHLDGWLLLTLAAPVLWGVYNNFTSAAWPQGLKPIAAGMLESFASGLLVIPMLALMPAAHAAPAPLAGYAAMLLGSILLAWVIERICFFSMIDHLGPVTTVQATYAATPLAVLLGWLIYGERPDAWLALSLALLFGALMLNAVQAPKRPIPAP